MSKKLIALLLGIMLAGSVIYGCARVAEEGPRGSIEGYTIAADGVTPIAGARVWTTGSIYETSTDTNGYFKLSAPPGTKNVYVQKGNFSAVLSSIIFIEGQTTPVGDQDKKIYLDPNKAQPGIQVTIGKMAVVTGSWDRIQDVLAKLGYGSADATTGELILGTEQFDLYDGDYTLNDASYKNFDALVTSPEAMSQYKVIFINCGNDYESLLNDSTVVGNIKNFVNAGGSLYVTDLSYDFVEQVFPEFIDFYGSDATPAANPETIDEAQVGTSGISVDATVLDDTLKTWLQGRGALNPSGTVSIAGFLSGWAVMNGVGSGTKSWIRGSVQYSGLSVTKQASRAAHSQSIILRASTTGEKPLTISFSYGSGKVLYSSYHTQEDPSPTLRPQEYILAYLVFEM